MSLDIWILIDKPKDATSTRISSQVRRLAGASKAGHLGTLDPLATGLLPIALNQATKTIPWVNDLTKTYEFSVRWGIATDTDDQDGIPLERCDYLPREQEILKALPQFCGEITQTPPAYSAIKIAGVRSYTRARRGESVTLPSRVVTIDTFNLVDLPSPDVARFRVLCSKGTYVRSLARDLARALNTFGHIQTLRRLTVGSFDICNAISLDYLKNVGHIPFGSSAVKQITEALADIPALSVSEDEQNKLLRGGRIDQKNLPPIKSALALCVYDKKAVAIVQEKDGGWQPIRVFNKME